jgi:hypothetical protein
MKTLLLFLVIACINTILNAQTTYGYAYDNAGNRYLRHVVELRNMQANHNGDSVALKETAKLGEMQINVMPNPTVGKLQINITNLPDNAEGGITVWDVHSKELVKQEGIYANNPIDLSKQPKGVYLMQIRVGKERSEWKVVKK